MLSSRYVRARAFVPLLRHSAVVACRGASCRVVARRGEAWRVVVCSQWYNDIRACLHACVSCADCSMLLACCSSSKGWLAQRVLHPTHVSRTGRTFYACFGMRAPGQDSSIDGASQRRLQPGPRWLQLQRRLWRFVRSFALRFRMCAVVIDFECSSSNSGLAKASQASVVDEVVVDALADTLHFFIVFFFSLSSTFCLCWHGRCGA